MREGGSHLQPPQGGEKKRQVSRQTEETGRRVQQAPSRSEETWQDAPRREYRSTPQQTSARSAEPWRETSRPRAAQPSEPAYRQNKRSRRQKQNALLILLIFLLAGGMLFAGGKLLSIFLNYRRDRSAYDELARLAIVDRDDSEDGSDAESEQDGEAAKHSEVPIAVDWDFLRSINSDVVGWLYCEGLLNYPVVQTSDNSFYLRRDFSTKQPNTSGTLFVDVNSVLGIVQSNYIIYGHNMKDGSMLAVIEDYITQEFYDEHPVMYYLTPDQDYRVDLIAGHIVESTIDNYPEYFYGNEYSPYLGKITSSSYFSTHADVTTDYQLMTLSTCDYSSGYNDPRFLLHGLMVPVE